MTIRYAAKHGPNLRNTINAIANAQPFNAGNLTATHEWSSVGWLPSEWVTILRSDNPSYVVYSYQTPIAWLSEGDWVIPDEKYSPTTDNHQSVVRRGVSRCVERR